MSTGSMTFSCQMFHMHVFSVEATMPAPTVLPRSAASIFTIMQEPWSSIYVWREGWQRYLNCACWVVLLLNNNIDSNALYSFHCSQLRRNSCQKCKLSWAGCSTCIMLIRAGPDPLWCCSTRRVERASIDQTFDIWHTVHENSTSRW